MFFKNEVFFCNSMLLENSAIDNKNNQMWLQNINIKLDSNVLLFYVYFFFLLKSKIMLITSYDNRTQNKISSVDKIFKSASWLERETGEMFKVSFLYKTDMRRLLLDYSKNENPLLKDYPVEGFNDVFYSFFEDQVVYNNSTVVEL